jgi:hypothetical protein
MTAAAAELPGAGVTRAAPQSHGAGIAKRPLFWPNALHRRKADCITEPALTGAAEDGWKGT